MADFVKTIANAVNVFGEGPSTKWGQALVAQTMTWGTSKWGEGNPVVFQVVKMIAESQSLAWDVTQKNPTKLIAESAAASSDMGSEELRNGIWKYVFTSDTTEGEQRDFATWTEGSEATTSFTCLSANGTSWSEE